MLAALPFAFIRLVRGKWWMVTLDLVIFLGMASLFVLVFRSWRVVAASMALSILCIIAMLTTIYMKGYSQVYWAYPALVVVFYLIKPRSAIVLTTLSLFGLLPILVGLDLFTQLTDIITLILTTIFAYIFASRTSEPRDLLLQPATRDPLTGIRNRRAFDEKIEDVIRL